MVWGISVVLALGVFLVFGQTAWFGFINYDDNLYVYENPVVQQGLTLTGVSGLIGIAGAAALMGLLGGMVGNNEMGFDPPRLVPWSAAMAMASLTLCGVIAGIYPARQAAMLQPVEALRKE